MGSWVSVLVFLPYTSAVCLYLRGAKLVSVNLHFTEEVIYSSQNLVADHGGREK